MRALFDNPAFIHHDDAVSLANGCQAVGDDDRGAAFHQMLKRILDQLLAFCVESAGRLVEQKDRGIAQQGAGDGDALPLPTREARPTFAEIGIETLRQFTQEIACISLLRCRPDRCVVGQPIAITQIVTRGGSEQHRILRHKRHALPELRRISAGKGDAVDTDGPSLGIVKPLRQLEQSRFACARGADHGNGFTGHDFQAEIIERSDFRAGWIAEFDILEFDLATRRRHGDRIGGGGDFRHFLHQLRQPRRGTRRAHQIAIDLR